MSLSPSHKLLFGSCQHGEHSGLKCELGQERSTEVCNSFDPAILQMQELRETTNAYQLAKLGIQERDFLIASHRRSEAAILAQADQLTCELNQANMTINDLNERYTASQLNLVTLFICLHYKVVEKPLTQQNCNFEHLLEICSWPCPCKRHTLYSILYQTDRQRPV